jgi:hypothetical protein
MNGDGLHSSRRERHTRILVLHRAGDAGQELAPHQGGEEIALDLPFY